VLVIRLRATIGSYAQYWNTSAKHNAGHLLYVALGDSAAQGIGASSIDNSYVKIVARHISKQTGKTVDIVNLSKSGGKLHDVLSDQLPKLAHLKPDFVTVDIGANDVVGGTSKDAMTHGYEQLISQLRTYRVVFANIPDFMLGAQQRSAQDMNKTIKELCLHYGVQQADLNDATMRKMWALNEFAADGFHPSNAGHRTWASSFLPGLDNLLS
jgi:acyl-CoA thioesterase-1